MSVEEFRLCIRVTNTKIIAQLIRSGGPKESDRTICQADSSELMTRYGVPLGLTNVPCGFLTGFLIACRTRFVHGGVPMDVSVDPGKRNPNSMLMSAIVKGATIGGLFPGNTEMDEHTSTVLHGKLITDYIAHLTQTTPEKLAVQFSRYQKIGLGPEHIGGLYESAFQAIAADPSPGPRKSKSDYKREAQLAREQKKRAPTAAPEQPPQCDDDDYSV